MKKIIYLTIIMLVAFSFTLRAADKVTTEQTFDYSTELKRDFDTAYGKYAKCKVLKDKIILLYFTASWCPPCRKFTPILVEFAKKHQDKLIVVVVSRDKTKSAAVKYMKKHNAKMFYLIKPGRYSNKLAAKFGIGGIPTVVAISKDGTLLSKNARGAITRSDKLPKTWE